MLESEEKAAVRVSVCIPTYNGSTFLAEAIASVLAQSFRDFELLIVDDCSTDATLEIARSCPDSRIQIHRNNKQLGIPANWNYCLSLARGEYIYLFHQDDVMLPQNLAQKMDILSSDTTVSLVHSAVEFLVEDSAPSPPANWLEEATEDFIVDGEIYFRKLLLRNLICAPAVMTRRQMLLDLGGFDETLGFTPDYAMWLKLCVKGQVAFLSQPLLLYRWHGANASHAYRFERGIAEGLTARNQALDYYVEQTGRKEEGELLRAVSKTLAASERRVAQLDLQSENQRAYIKDLEHERDQLWAELQRIGKGWEEQRTHIENQQACITNLECERDRLLSHPLWRLAQKIRRSSR